MFVFNLYLEKLSQIETEYIAKELNNLSCVLDYVFRHGRIRLRLSKKRFFFVFDIKGYSLTTNSCTSIHIIHVLCVIFDLLVAAAKVQFQKTV